MAEKLTAAQREALKAELAQFTSTARAVWQAMLDAPEWTIPDTEHAVPQGWHTRAIVHQHKEGEN